MEKYIEYKDSGIPWIGKVPSHWEIKRNKNCFSYEKSIVGLKSSEVQLLSLTTTGIKKKSFDDIGGKIPESYDTYQFVQKNDLVMCLFDLDCSAVFSGLSQYDGMISPAYKVISCKDNILPGFADYWFRSVFVGRKFKYLSKNIRYSLTYEDFSALTLPYPSLPEQKAIVEYLDATCTNIDKVVAEAKASIEEYKAWKQAIIDETILGYDNIHIKLRQLGTLKNGINFSHTEAFPNIKFLGVGCFKDNMVLDRIEDFADEHIAFEVGDDYLLRDGDIVFVRSNGSKELVGRSVMIKNITSPVTFSGFCIRFRNLRQELIDNHFLLYYFKTSYFKQTLLKYSNDSTNINNLNQEMLNAIYIEAPKKEMQLQITEALTQRINAINSVIREKEALLADLETYKKSLIFEVVTGKRRVF